MGFFFFVVDYVESCIFFDQQIIRYFLVIYFMRVVDSYYCEGILQGVLLVVDFLFILVDGFLFVCVLDGEYCVKRYWKYLCQYLEDLRIGKKEVLLKDDDGCMSSNVVFGVIIYIINDVRSGEFDDCFVMQEN